MTIVTEFQKLDIVKYSEDIVLEWSLSWNFSNCTYKIWEAHNTSCPLSFFGENQISQCLTKASIKLGQMFCKWKRTIHPSYFWLYKPNSCGLASSGKFIHKFMVEVHSHPLCHQFYRKVPYLHRNQVDSCEYFIIAKLTRNLQIYSWIWHCRKAPSSPIFL